MRPFEIELPERVWFKIKEWVGVTNRTNFIGPDAQLARSFEGFTHLSRVTSQPHEAP